ncbi:uncharacterized protein ACA1_068520 [Acanthamoeba castellanii str. Neff]|uniref:Centromere/kinetochore protein zw10 n=1 Tax=Acanthamoeba castellanii (strain ATCC 30010 / Neff) TaxID=1257118 RepID=L8HES3_ACACF|nr:uncharacterized protein ACA1_068520 [Acanthamoeba castellanii str. Neff]ELR23268.1 hypothetical protein ACA1_068520 [Acanthamoeba castellanii str. Neff]
MENTLLKVREGEETSWQAEQVDKTTTGEVEQALDSLRGDLAADRDTTKAGSKLSQGDLVLCLSKLNDQIHSLKGQVYDAIGQSYEEFIQAFDNAVYVEKAIAELTDGLAAVTQQIEDPHTGIHAALVKPALELEHITQQAALTGELIQTVTVLNQGELLRQLPTEDQDTRNVPAVFIAVKKRHRRRCDRLKARLGALLRQALTFEATSLSYSPLLTVLTRTTQRPTVHLSSQEGKQVVTVPLADIFEAMDSVDEEGAPDQHHRFLEREMEEFVCHALRTGVLHFILAHAFSGQAWEVRADEAEHKRIYLAEKQRLDEAVSERAHDAKSERAVSVDNLFGVLGAFFGILSSHVFAHDKQRLALLGHLLWEPLCRDIIAKVLSPAIPSDTAKLAQYQRETIHATEKFEEEMVALGLVPASAASGPDDHHSDNDPRQPPPAEARRLSRFINNVDNHFATKKQKKILNRARNLLLNQEANVCLKEVCTANMLPDVSSFLTINATADVNANANADKRRRRRQSAMQASAGAGSGGGADDVDVYVDEREEEGLRRIATQSKKGECRDVATGATPPTDDRVFIFQMPTCQVSASTIGLVVLAQHTLEEACRLRDSAPQCAHTLQQTARDLFDLYRAIMPLQYQCAVACEQKETIKSVPSLAMAFHNDCFYLALQLLTLGMQYQDRLPKDKGAFTLVDLVPVFRQLGEKQYQQQVLRVRFMTVERAMKRVVHHLTHLSRVWKDVLPRHVYLRTVGQLLDVALEDLIASFEKLEDISEEETHHLHELLSLLLDCSSFFTATAAEDEGGDSEGGQAVLAESGREEETKRHARRWSKFVKIVNMLESKLVIIVDAYVKGLMPEFEAEELKAIIRALFSDSPLRKSQLALIK